jgi:hypothetical protein
MLHQNLQYSIDDIHLPIMKVFLRSTRFCKLSNNSHNASYEFLRNTNVREVVERLSGERGMDFISLKNVYTLTATYTIEYDEEWQHIFNKQQYNLFEDQGEYILGYLIVHKNSDMRRSRGECGGLEDEGDGGWGEGEGDGDVDRVSIEIDLENNCIRDTNSIHYIDAMDTRLRGYQLGALMIKYYEAVYSYGSCPNGCIACLPFKVDDRSVVYWRKYLEKHNVYTSGDVNYIMKEYGISDIVNWNELIAEYDRSNISIWRK